MTINLLTHVPEGLVMIADSMVSARRHIDGEPHTITFERARKLFRLGKTHPAAAMLSGIGHIGGCLVSQLLRHAARDIDRSRDVVDHDACVAAVVARISPAYDEFLEDIRVDVAAELTSDPDELRELNKKRVTAGLPEVAAASPEMIGISGADRTAKPLWEIEAPQLSVIVASYFEEAAAAELTWPGATRVDLSSDDTYGTWWWGSGSTPLTRLVQGIDLDQLHADAATDSAAAEVLKYFHAQSDRYGLTTAHNMMPMQQAIYYTEYLADVAVGYERFKVGPPTVGGEIDVAVLMDSEMKWIHKQQLTSSLGEMNLAGWQ